MRTLIFALIPALLVACSEDTVATTVSAGSNSTSGDSSTSPTTTSSDSSTPSTDPSTSIGSITATDSGPITDSGPTTDSGPATDSGQTTSPATSSTSDPSTSFDPSTSSSTGEPGSSSGDTTTGGVVGCGMDGPEVEATLVHAGVEPGCGTIEFNGTNISDSQGPVYALDGCPCGANCLKPDPWTFTLDVPKDWQPGKLSACPRIVVERQMSKAGCELVGVSIWDTKEPGKLPARFHAGSLLGPIAAAQGELQLEQIVAEECDCDNCCNTPTRLDLKFTTLADSLTLAEGAEGTVGGNEVGYNVKSFQSHLSGICDDAPAIDWVMKRFVAP